MVDIKIYSNLETVSLTINGMPLQAQAPDRRIALWHGVNLKPGNNTIAATGRRGRMIVRDTVLWRYDPAP